MKYDATVHTDGFITGNAIVYTEAPVSYKENKMNELEKLNVIKKNLENCIEALDSIKRELKSIPNGGDAKDVRADISDYLYYLSQGL